METQHAPLTLREILRQPETWRQAIRVVGGLSARAKALVKEAKPDVYLFTGCGTSYYLSIAAAGLFQECTGLPARAVPASELILSAETHLPVGQKGALIAFSRSGETTETIVALRQHMARQCGPGIAVTCRMHSAMEDSADLTVALPAADDRSVVMTSSFTSMLLAAQVLSAYLGPNDSLLAGLQALPGRLQEQLERQRAFAEALGRDRSHQQFIYLGIGPFFGLGSEGMLKMKEMTQVPSETYSPLEFRHGPMSIVRQGTLAVLLSSDRASRQELDVLRDIRSLGGRTLRIGAEAEAGGADLRFAVGGDLAESLRGLLYMPLLQMTAYYRAMELGLDPDRPQHLTRVVVLSEESLLGECCRI
ncbi:MAG: SIS domain-containing protein [Bacillota bacterium]